MITDKKRRMMRLVKVASGYNISKEDLVKGITEWYEGLEICPWGTCDYGLCEALIPQAKISSDHCPCSIHTHSDLIQFAEYLLDRLPKLEK